jgi:hypothetical protein
VIGLQFHLEPKAINVRTMAINDGQYANEGNDLHQTATEILQAPVPVENKMAINAIFDFLTETD